MKSESIPPSLRNLLTKLEYISMIERGQKPCFSDMTFVNSNSWMGAWKRLFSGENRKNLLFEIEQIIDRTILAIEEYTNKDYVKLLLDNLSKAKSGIENLILTYTEHPDTVSNLRVHIINIELTLKKHGYTINHRSDPMEFQKIIDHLSGSPLQPTVQGTGQGTGPSSQEDSRVDIKKRTTPLPIHTELKVLPNLSVSTENSFKRFTPKDYIEKHILSTSNSSSEAKLPSSQDDI